MLPLRPPTQSTLWLTSWIGIVTWGAAGAGTAGAAAGAASLARATASARLAFSSAIWPRSAASRISMRASWLARRLRVSSSGMVERSWASSLRRLWTSVSRAMVVARACISCCSKRSASPFLSWSRVLQRACSRASSPSRRALSPSRALYLPMSARAQAPAWCWTMWMSRHIFSSSAGTQAGCDSPAQKAPATSPAFTAASHSSATWAAVRALRKRKMTCA